MVVAQAGTRGQYVTLQHDCFLLQNLVIMRMGMCCSQCGNFSDLDKFPCEFKQVTMEVSSSPFCDIGPRVVFQVVISGLESQLRHNQANGSVPYQAVLPACCCIQSSAAQILVCTVY